MKNILYILTVVVFFLAGSNVFGQGSESCNSMPTIGAYGTGTWSGDNGLTWTATDARSDQTLTGKAVTLRNGSLTCNAMPGGCGTLTFNYKRAFSGNSTLKVFVNGVQYGASITVSSTTATLASITVNVAGSFNLEIRNATKRTVIDDIAWTAVSSCTAPTTQASAMTFSGVGTTTTTVNWTRGNGNAVIVVAQANGATLTDPTSGTTYTANTTFGSGTQIGTGNFVVYSGTGTSVNVTALTATTTYNYAVYEYNTTGTCYNLVELAGTQATTSCSTPTTQASSMAFTGVTGTATTVNWTRGNGTAGVIVVAKLNTATLTDPTSGTAYTANAIFGSGTQIGTGNFVVYKGVGTSVNVTGLTAASTYNYAVYEYNTAGVCYNITELSGTQATTCVTPTTQASTMTFTGVTSSAMTIGWTRGNGDGVLVVVKSGSIVSTDPTGGTAYTANAAFGSGTQIGTGNFVVYQGVGTSVNITGLTSGTTYHVAVYEYGGAGGTCYNLIQLAGSQATTTAPCITDGFEGGIPAGWTASAVTTTSNATNAHGGTKYANFNSNSDKLKTDIQANPNVLTFWVRASGTTSNYSFNVQTSPDNVTWTTQTTFAANGSNTGTITTTYSQKTVTLSLVGNYYIRFTQTSRFGGSCYLDDVNLDCSVACSAPATQASAMTFSGVGTTSTTVNWTRGNGTAGVIVVAQANGATLTDPVSTDVATYTANATFGSGTQLGVGNYIVYQGTGTSINVLGLTSATTYNYAVYEYNTTGSCINLTELAGTQATTSCTTPTTQASAITFSGITGTGTAVNWTRGNGTAGVIVVAKLNTATLTDPTSGVTYTANAAFGSGTQIGTGNFVVYKGVGTSVNVTGLTAAASYDYAVYEYNTASTCYNPVELAGSQATLCTTPTTQASTVTFTGVTSSGMTINWARGNGDGVLVVVKSGLAVDTDPSGGTVYTANTAFGSGTQIGTGNYVVYQGTGTSVSITGLTTSSTYHVAIYEYGGAGGTCYNLIQTTGNQTTLSLPCIDESFEAGTPAGWTLTNVSLSGLFTPITGTKVAYMNSLTDKMVTSLITNPTTLTFWLQASNTTAYYDFVVETSPDGVTWTNQATYSANNTNTGSITTIYSQKTVNLNLVGTYYLRFKFSNFFSTGLVVEDVKAYCYTGPEINVKQSTTNYLNASTYDFGSTAVGANSDVIFTVENTGLSSLSLSTPLPTTGDYTIISQPLSSIAAPGTSTFTVRFTPTAGGTRTGSVTLTNNDATGSESTYVINFTGSGYAGSNSSDIIANTVFTYPVNIDYTLYPPTANIITTNSIECYQFDIRDGGAVNDADALSTTLTDLTLSITNASLLDRVALYDGTTELAELAAASTITFTGLTAVALDNSSKTLNLRVTFSTTVTDNAQFSFTTTNAAANGVGSIFGATNAGGAVSSIVGNNNRIEVLASTIAWGTQPADQITTFNLTTVTVNAVDANGNTDLDENTCTIALTTTGVGITSSTPYTFVSGVVSMSDIQFSSANTGITLTATAQTCLGNGATTSSTFNITTFTYLSGDWRTTTAGAGLAFNGYGWESFNGIIWTAENIAPQNVGVSPSRIIIKHGSVDGGDNTGENGTRTFEYNDIIILPGGELILNDICSHPLKVDFAFSDPTKHSTPGLALIATGKVLDVYSGGTLVINGDIDMGSSTRTLRVRDGGGMILNQSTIMNTHRIWIGTEDFQDNSTLTINDWDWAEGTATKRSLLNPIYQVDINSSGNNYRFGNIIYDCTPTTQNQTILPALSNNLNFCNNFTIRNKSSIYVMSVTANKIQSPIYRIKNNFTVQEGMVSFSINYSSGTGGTWQKIFVNGNIDVQNLNPSNATKLYLHYLESAYYGIVLTDIRVNTFGNINVDAGATFNTSPAADNNSLQHTRLQFSGTTTQTITNAGTIKLSNVHINNATDVIIASGNFTATDTLAFDAGHFRLQGAGSITLGSATVEGFEATASSTKYVSTEGSGSYTKTQLPTGINHVFPIGTSVTSYNPATINYTGTLDDFSARVTTGITSLVGMSATESVNRTWFIAEGTPGATNATITNQWETAHENGGMAAVRSTSNIFHYVGGALQEENFLGRAVAGSPYTTTASNITSFSPFGIGKVGAVISLPVELLEFNVKTINNDVYLDWSTAIEINNEHFEIQRSIDGENYHTIKELVGAGNSNRQNDYYSIDQNTPSGVLYYRLKQVDFDGKYSYSTVKTVFVSKIENEVGFINSTDRVIIYDLNEQFTVELFNMFGQLIEKRQSSNLVTFYKSNYTTGVYLIKVSSATESKTWKANL